MRHCALLLLAGLLALAGCATRREDCTAGQTGICEVHGLRMGRTVVPIVYGLVRLDERGLAQFAASTNSFPNAEDRVWGGCCVDRARQAVIYTCPECQQRRAQWEADYDNALATQNPGVPPTRSGYVFVAGEVMTPGRCPWTNGLTLFAVIEAAGGFTSHAKPAATTIRHETGVVEKVNCTGRPTDAWASTRLAPDDRVMVPRKLW